ncbi:MAG: hypothetical protein B7Z44_18390 [Caulobacter sp. 12-67-6]|nr:MAG: hypothetical protein B7Z44_18390 [Caulobacter sp. 12-67-6]OYX73063.1 MAG: hypothetical protein B7Y81_05035 [Caulobacter sp. 32-67-35]OYX96539.1 MAG: hypothetical protein B7Y78_03505 [Caulobacter sp. 35-67-4]
MAFQQILQETSATRPSAISAPLRSPTMLTPINVLATRLGVTARALRHYEAIGLVSSGRGSRGVRCYDQDTVAILEAITLLRGVDVPIAEIRAVMSQRSDPKAYIRALRNVLADALLERRRCVAAIEALMVDVGATFTSVRAEDE